MSHFDFDEQAVGIGHEYRLFWKPSHGEASYTIGSVWYCEPNNPKTITGWNTDLPEQIWGDPASIQRELFKMQEAFTKPHLKTTDYPFLVWDGNDEGTYTLGPYIQEM